LWLEASLSKWFSRPYLEKNPLQKRAGGVAQGVVQIPALQKKKKKRKTPYLPPFQEPCPVDM
jgi:hypothetical protein